MVFVGNGPRQSKIIEQPVRRASLAFFVCLVVSVSSLCVFILSRSLALVSSCLSRYSQQWLRRRTENFPSVSLGICEYVYVSLASVLVFPPCPCRVTNSTE